MRKYISIWYLYMVYKIYIENVEYLTAGYLLQEVVTYKTGYSADLGCWKV